MQLLKDFVELTLERSDSPAAMFTQPVVFHVQEFVHDDFEAVDVAGLKHLADQLPVFAGSERIFDAEFCLVGIAEELDCQVVFGLGRNRRFACLVFCRL